MNTAGKVVRFQLHDLVRNRWLLGYTLVLLGLTSALLWLGGGGERAIVSLLDVVLILVPLASVMFGTLYLYNAREFIELLLAQPVGRPAMFAGLYAGLTVPLVGGFGLGIGLPLLVSSATVSIPARALIILLATGILLTLIFTAVAFLLALRFEDRARGLGAALAVWLAFAVLYDGLVLLVVLAFGEYPLESPLLALTMLNPVDLGRVLLLLQFDIAALMGYTGAVFQRFFGDTLGMATAMLALFIWVLIPLTIGLRWFRRRDF
ncbi:MAG TPA: ABC transporter permease subunit [Gemmatimonadales bacterium]|nr:ABC transporter permease subunit [Gemmatimonadales bacterium]